MKKHLVLAAVLFALSSCGDKNPPDNGSKLTPDENKAKMENIAIEFADFINPDDFTEFSDVMDYLVNEIGLPEGLEGEDDSPVSRLSGAASPLLFGKFGLLNKINFAATRAADYAASDIYGIYTYDGGSWVETPGDTELKLVYPFGGETVTITATATGTAHETEIEGETYAIPATVSVKMTVGQKTLVDVSVGITGVNANATTGVVATSVYVCGYQINTNTNVTSGGVNTLVTVKKGDTMLIDVSVSGTGSNFVPTEPYDDEEWNGRIGALNGTVNIMGKVWAKISSANFQKYIDGMEDLDDDYYSKPYDNDYAEQATKLFNDNINIFMNYDGSNNPIAYHEYKVILEDYYGYTDQYGESYIVFNSDGSKFLLDEFFNENDFSDLIDVLDELVEDFEDKFE